MSATRSKADPWGDPGTWPAPDAPGGGGRSPWATALRLLAGLAPLVVFGSMVRTVAAEWGIFGVLVLCLGAGALAGFALSVRAGMDLLQIYECTRLGLLPGFLAWLVLAPLLSWLGFEEDTGPIKEHEARLAAVEAAMVGASGRPDLPFHRLRAEVEGALRRLPDHPNDRPRSVRGLLARLDRPDPRVRAQVLMALGRFEGYGEQTVPAFSAALNDADPRVRAGAVVGLSGVRPLRQPQQLQVLAMLDDPDRDVRLAAAEAVRSLAPLMKGEAWRAGLRDATARADPELRDRLAGLLR